ncbi:MAG: DUF4175 domain-containing protein [Rhodobacteraceae bacterium]|nr:DUF4175 domain-containing protein [Paracoccaceae bacterium]
MQPRGKFTEANRRAKLLRGLNGRITLTKLSLTVERFLRAFWPLLSLLGFVYAALAFGAINALPARAGLGVLAVSGLLGLWLIYRGFKRFRLPSRSQALEKLDESLNNRPIASLQDTPALNTNDPFAQSLWQAHIAEMQAQAAHARAPLPAPKLAGQDRSGLRLLALAGVFAAILFAPRIGVETLQTVLGGEAVASAPSVAIEAWATPPAYTGKPAIYLTELANGSPIELPIGSEITLRTYGDGDFSLNEGVSGTGAALTSPEPDTPPRDARFKVLLDGAVELLDGNNTLGQWQISVLEDTPPTIAAPDGIGKSREGELSIEYAATDDYGIVSTRYVIRPDLARVNRSFGLAPEPVAMPEDMVGELPLPFTQDLSDIKETLLADFSKAMWAHLPVTITLEVTDSAGQTASIELETDALPALSFFDPLAGAIVEQRRDLMWSSENDRRVSQVLRAISYKPEDGLFPSASTYLLLRSAIRRMGYQMEDGLTAGERTDLEELLWRIAEQIENGDLTGAAARLARAQERLSQALEDDATNEEIAGLMDELRQATEDYLDEMARNMDPNQQAQNQQQGQSITSDQLQEMLDRLQELSESGQREEAQQLLDEIRRFMENMQMTQGSGSGQPRGNAEQQQLQDGLQEQQQLSDEAFQQLQEQFGQQGQQEGQSLAERQEELRQFIEELREQGSGSEALDEAERNMGEARDRLREGDFSGAFDEQAQAMENMRETLREMENQQQAGQSGSGGEETSERNQFDPLGRSIGNRGRADGDTAVPDQNASERARELLGEIRRRTGESQRPAEELDYLKRLLDRF